MSITVVFLFPVLAHSEVKFVTYFGYGELVGYSEELNFIDLDLIGAEEVLLFKSWGGRIPEDFVLVNEDIFFDENLTSQTPCNVEKIVPPIESLMLADYTRDAADPLPKNGSTFYESFCTFLT